MENNSSQPELLWLQRLQHNDEQALALLMRHYYTDLYNYASGFRKDPTLIKDCIQEVFISLWQRRENATAILSPQYYLLRAVKNKMLKAIDLNAYKTCALVPEKEYDFFCEFSVERMIIERQLSEEKATRLQRVINTLTKRQQEIIYLKYYQHLDHTQIAALMNISTQSVYNLLHETIQRLKAVWYTELVPR